MSSKSTLFAFSVNPNKCVPVSVFHRYLSTNKPLLKSSRIFIAIHARKYISNMISEFAHDHLIIKECALYSCLFSFNMHLALSLTFIHLPFSFIDVSILIEHSTFTPMSLEFKHHSFIYIPSRIKTNMDKLNNVFLFT